MVYTGRMRAILLLLLCVGICQPAAAQWVRPKKAQPAPAPAEKAVPISPQLQDMPIPREAPTANPLGPCTAQDKARLETYNQLNDYISEELTSTQQRQLLERLPRAPETLIDEMTDTPEEIDFIAKLIIRCTPDEPAQR